MSDESVNPEETASDEPEVTETEEVAVAPETQASAPEAEEAPAEQADAPDEAPAAAKPKKAKAKKKEDAEAVIPGADLVPDIVPEGQEAISAEEVDEFADPNADEDASGDTEEVVEEVVVVQASIDLGKDARYHATGKRKSAIARVTLKPGKGEYIVNGRSIEEMFPRERLTKTIRQPLEAVGFEDKMDVEALLHGGGVSAGAEALRHGISRALVKADPNLRSELKRRGFLTRDPRVVERKKAGLKKARKRPQFSKR